MHDMVSMFGIEVTCYTVESLHQRIQRAVQDNEHIFIGNVNVNALNLLCVNREFNKSLQMADSIFCDGHGVMLAARLLGKNIPEKITYADWLPLLAKFCAKNGLRMYFLGGHPGVASVAAQKLQSREPSLTVCGVHHGYFDMNADSKENLGVIHEINQSSPDIVLVCFGMPRQEIWLNENWDKIKASVALTGGAAFDYISGTLRRPPLWMTRHGLEWLGRLCIEPRRLFHRYVTGHIVFGLRLVREKWFQSNRNGKTLRG